jgi:hypothetical protein
MLKRLAHENMRYFAGSFWTPITDARLQHFEAQGLSAAKVAAKLRVSRNSVIARSQRLRGLSRRFPSYLREQEKARARVVARKRTMEPVLSKLRQEIARGGARNEAIIRARKAAATLHAIGDVVGLTREWVWQISIDQCGGIIRSRPTSQVARFPAGKLGR